MKDETFSWLWKEIDASTQSIMNRLNQNSQVVKLTYGSMGERVIRKRYDQIRDELKSRCYSELVCGGSDDNLIDHHKIAACFCKALIDKKLLKFKMDARSTGELLRSNYELAYTVSLRIVHLYMIYHYQVDGRMDLAEKLKKNGCLYSPETTPSHDSYDLGRIKTLALNDHYGIEFDLLTYADMMFWLEYYNRQLLESQIDVRFPSGDL